MGVVETRTRLVSSALVLVLVLAGWPLSAETKTKTKTKVETKTKVVADWKRGLLVARCGASADLRAVSVALARVKAERIARRRCSTRLWSAARRLPAASGGTLGSLLPPKMPSPVGSLIGLSDDQGSDGSVVVQVALAMDTLRALTFGADVPLGALPLGPVGIVVDARGTGLLPAVGYALGKGQTAYRGSVLFFRSVATARGDVRFGKAAKVYKADLLDGGVLEFVGLTLASIAATHPLIGIVYSEEK